MSEIESEYAYEEARSVLAFLGQFAYGLRLCRSGCVVRHLAGVSAVLDHHPGGDDIDDAELFGDGTDHLLARRGDNHDVRDRRRGARRSRAAASAYTYGF